MNALPELIALAVATCGSFYFSGIETGIYALNRVRLRVRAEEGDRRAQRVLRLILQPQRTISTILIGNHTANYAATFFCMALLVSAFEVEDVELVNTLVLTPFLFVFGEILPKDAFRMRADTLVYRWSRPLAIACVVFRPAALLLRWFGHVSRALPRTGAPVDAILSRDRLGELVKEVAEDGVLTEEQERMVRNVLRVSSIPVRDAMVGLAQVATVPEGFTRDQVVAASASGSHTRIPVRASATGRFIGFVHLLDLLYRPDAGPADLVREAPAIREDVTVEQALNSLRRHRQTMGFVTDGAGRTRGIVTVKDLVEEVSGELPAF